MLFPKVYEGQRILARVGNGRRGLAVPDYAKLGVLDFMHPNVPLVKEGDVWFFEVEEETLPDSRKGVYILAPLRLVNPTTEVAQITQLYADAHPNLHTALCSMGAVRLETVAAPQVFVPLSSAKFRAMHVFPDGTAQTEGRQRKAISVQEVAELLHGRAHSSSNRIYWVPALDQITSAKLRIDVPRLRRVTHNLLWLFGILREEADDRRSLLEAASWLHPNAEPQSARWLDMTKKTWVVKYHDPREVLGVDGANIVPIRKVFALNGLQLEIGVTKEGRRRSVQNS